MLEVIGTELRFIWSALFACLRTSFTRVFYARLLRTSFSHVFYARRLCALHAEIMQSIWSAIVLIRTGKSNRAGLQIKVVSTLKHHNVTGSLVMKCRGQKWRKLVMLLYFSENRFAMVPVFLAFSVIVPLHQGSIWNDYKCYSALEWSWHLSTRFPESFNRYCIFGKHIWAV